MMSYDANALFYFETVCDGRPVFDFIRLIQAREVMMAAGGEVFLHTQACHEITYIVSGSGMISTGSTEFQVSKGDIHVISAGDDHRIIASDSEKLRYICIGFNFIDIPEEYSSVCRFFEASPKFLVNCTSDTRALFDLLIGEFAAERENRNQAVAELLKLILINTFRCFTEYSRTEEMKIRSRISVDTAYSILRYVDSHIESVRTVGEIARQLHYTESYISTVFKRRMGITLQTYIREKKLETAHMLLEHGRRTVPEVTELLKFDRPQTFSKNFKKLYGITPHQLLLRKRKDDSCDKQANDG